jgi:hypothetical protein
MKKFLSMIAIASMLAFTWACDEDEKPAVPTVTTGTSVTNVQLSQQAQITFEFAAPGGYKSAAVTQVGGTATISAEPADGAKDGEVVVTFTAGTSAGAGSITLSLTDNSNQIATATAVVNVTVPNAPAVTAPAAASVTVNQKVDVTFAVNAPGGYKSAALSALVGGTATIKTQPSVGATTGNVVVEFSAGAAAGAGSSTLTVTDNNNLTGFATSVITVSTSPVPSIAGIPATASVTAGALLGPVPATITMANLPGTFTITKNGVAYGSSVAITTNGQVVNFQYTPTIAESGSNITFVFTAEDSDGDETSVTHVLTVNAPTFPKVVVNTNITSNTTWSKANIYELASRVIVEPGFTLTIEAGTVIKGQPGSGVNATALIIARGAQIIADGTAAAPIIFTSTSDNILPGQITSNLTETNSGLWGGLILLGKAPISDADNNNEAIIEGIPGDVSLAGYGGTIANDNSGILDYVSIRHGGSVLGEGSEINGLTLGGVGSGTTVTNIEVVANLDDGVELFGGTVNLTNVMIWAADDDGLDIDQAYSGTVDNVIVIAFSGTDHNLEIDGPEGTAAGRFTIKNVSCKGVDDEIADLREKATGLIDGYYSFGFTSAALNDEGDFALSTATVVGATGVDMNFANMQHTLVGADVLGDVFPATVVPFVTAVAAGANTQGADETKFNWTFAFAKGAITGF